MERMYLVSRLDRDVVLWDVVAGLGCDLQGVIVMLNFLKKRIRPRPADFSYQELIDHERTRHSSCMAMLDKDIRELEAAKIYETRDHLRTMQRLGTAAQEAENLVNIYTSRRKP